MYFREHTKNIFRTWIYVLAEDEEKPIMIAPIQVIRLGAEFMGIGLERAFYFIGRQGYSDYLNFIYKDFSEKAVLCIFSYLQKTYGISKCYFERLLEQTELYRYIEKTYKIQQTECYCASLVLPHTFEEYKGLLSKSTRQNIRTAINRQNRNNLELTHEMIYDVDDEMAKTLMTIREQRLGEKRAKASAKASWRGRLYHRFRSLLIMLFNAKHNVITECCNPWCFLVKDNDRIVSYFWGMKNYYKGEYYVILAGVDKEFAWYSPSLSHLYLFLEEQYEKEDETIKVIDFTRGGERYKEDMGASKKSAWAVRFDFLPE